MWSIRARSRRKVTMTQRKNDDAGAGEKDDFDFFANEYQATGSTWTLTRMAPEEYKGVKTAGFLKKYTDTTLLPDKEFIKRHFGGGTYRLNGRRKNGTNMPHVDFDIEGSPRVEGGEETSAKLSEVQLWEIEERRAERARQREEEIRAREAELAREKIRDTERTNDRMMEFMAQAMNNRGGETLLATTEARISSLQQSHSDEMRALRESHQREMAHQRDMFEQRIEDLQHDTRRASADTDRMRAEEKAFHQREMERADRAHAEALAAVRRDLEAERSKHVSELSALRQSHAQDIQGIVTRNDHLLAQIKSNHEHVLAMKDDILGRHKEDIAAKAKEIEALKAQKVQDPLEMFEKVQHLREVFVGEKDDGIGSQIIQGLSGAFAERMGPMLAGSGEPLALPAAPPQPWPNPAPTPPSTTTAPSARRAFSFLGNGAQPQPRQTIETVEIPPAVLATAVAALESQFAQRLDPSAVAVQLAQRIPEDLRRSLSQPTGIRTFIHHVSRTKPASSLLAPDGQQWLMQVGQSL